MFQKEIHLKFMVDFPFSSASFHWGPKIFCSSPPSIHWIFRLADIFGSTCLWERFHIASFCRSFALPFFILLEGRFSQFLSQKKKIKNIHGTNGSFNLHEWLILYGNWNVCKYTIVPWILWDERRQQKFPTSRWNTSFCWRVLFYRSKFFG